MKLIDTNILIYAIDSTTTRHESAKRWLEATLSGAETTSFAWLALIAFIRITTSPRIMESPLSSEGAFEIVEGWLEQPCAIVIHPGAHHARLMRELLAPAGAAGNLTNDAHLAALAIEHGAELCSVDADFGQFSGLRWTNPLKGR